MELFGLVQGTAQTCSGKFAVLLIDVLGHAQETSRRFRPITEFWSDMLSELLERFSKTSQMCSGNSRGLSREPLENNQESFCTCSGNLLNVLRTLL